MIRQLPKRGTTAPMLFCFMLLFMLVFFLFFYSFILLFFYVLFSPVSTHSLRKSTVYFYYEKENPWEGARNQRASTVWRQYYVLCMYSGLYVYHCIEQKPGQFAKDKSNLSLNCFLRLFCVPSQSPDAAI